jgi:hypothetical protein
MLEKDARKPPTGAPEGTVWFGGPVDTFRITLRISGDDLDPEQVSALLGCVPTRAKRGQWHLMLDSRDLGESYEIDDGVKVLLERLPADLSVWAGLTSSYKVDLFCGLFLEADNRGIEIPAEILKLLSDRRIPMGFDIYCSCGDRQPAT